MFSFPVSCRYSFVYSSLILLGIFFVADASTRIIGGSLIAVAEGNTISITCRSSGVPTPNVTWEFNSAQLSLNTIESRDPSQARVDRNDSGIYVPITVLGNLTSMLEITNAQYLNHDGVYTCIGSNDDLMVVTTSAMVTVQVHGM